MTHAEQRAKLINGHYTINAVGVVKKQPGKIRHKPSEALLRGQNDRRLNIRAFDKCPYTNKKLRAAWERGWLIVDKFELGDADDLTRPEEK